MAKSRANEEKEKNEAAQAAAEAAQTPDEETPAQEVAAEIDYEAIIAAEKDKYLRLAAEYDNFRKRSQREREAMFTDIRGETVERLLPVYDNLQRALKMPCSDESFYKGVEMTMTQLEEIFESMGITAIATTGELFNPDRHNAVVHLQDESLGKGVITEEFQKGFILGDKVIRFAMVAVAN